jgi:hypothetical protein
MTIKFNRQYYKALFGTSFMFILIALGSFSIGMQERFSFMWFIGAINIIGTFTIMLYINYRFIVFTKNEVSQDD